MLRAVGSMEMGTVIIRHRFKGQRTSTHRTTFNSPRIVTIDGILGTTCWAITSASIFDPKQQCRPFAAIAPTSSRSNRFNVKRISRKEYRTNAVDPMTRNADNSDIQRYMTLPGLNLVPSHHTNTDSCCVYLARCRRVLWPSLTQHIR